MGIRKLLVSANQSGYLIDAKHMLNTLFTIIFRQNSKSKEVYDMKDNGGTTFVHNDYLLVLFLFFEKKHLFIEEEDDKSC